MQLISRIGQFLVRLGRSFIILLTTIFIDIPLRLLRLIFPPLRDNAPQMTKDRAKNLEKAISAMSAVQEAIQICEDGLHKIRENRPENWENAISVAENALQVLTIGNFPELLGHEKYPLAFAYQYRIMGDKAENLEKAIAYYQEVLQVYTFDTFPEVWAETQRNLGDAYYAQKFRGDRAKNLEDAIACYQKALQVYTFESFPKDWAATQNNLALAYTNRIIGDKAKSLEDAIACYQKALQVYTFEAFPEYWADIQNNLASAYAQRIRGDIADNLERAIACCKEALRVRTFEAFPKDWAETQHNLADAHFKRIRGDRAENLEKAITYYQEALDVRTFDSFPEDWAITQHDLAIAYQYRIKGDIAENLEKAIVCYQEALKVRTFDAFPKDWADTKHNLANAYIKRIREDKAKNLEYAIDCYQEALKVRTFDSFPQDWADTQNNLANAYLDGIEGNKADNIEKAITAYQNALKVYTQESNPIKCLGTAFNLGSLHFRENNWQEAANAYHLAIEAVETFRLEALNPQRRQEILSNAIVVYHNIVQSYLNLDRPDKALEYVERSKTRELVELFSQKETYPKGISETIKTQLDSLRLAIINENNRLAIEEQNRNNRFEMLTNEPREQAILIDYTHLNQLRQQLDEFIEGEITPIDPDFILTQEVKPIPFNEIQALTDEHTAILQWYITGDKILVFVIPPNPPFKGGNHGEVRVWQSSAEDREGLIDWINEYLGIYYQNKAEYIKTLPSRLSRLSELLHINEILEYEEMKNSDRLILIPHWFLHLLPLHALPLSPPLLRGAGGDQNEGELLSDNKGESHELFCDRFNITYAPSCQILQRIQNRNRPHFNNLFAIQNPTNDLLFTNLEVETIHTLFDQATILVKEEATETALTNHSDIFNAHCIHFSCHGTFNLRSPLESALKLANNERLELGEIFQLDLNQCRLIVLSACETGLIDTNSLSDEYFGLPSGFLFAGSQTVVSSLWEVDDLSTAFLMIKFYEQLPKHPQKGEITIALKQAQDWLKTLTIEEFEQKLEQLSPQFYQILEKLGGGKHLIFNESLKQIRKRKPYPFENPYYWAGFIATGF